MSHLTSERKLVRTILRGVAVLLAATFVIGGASCTGVSDTEEAASWETFKASNFTVEYPQGWASERIDASSLDPAGQVFAPNTVDGVLFAPSQSNLEGRTQTLFGSEAAPSPVVFGVISLSGSGFSAKELADMSRFSSKNFADFEELSFGPATVDGHEGYRFVFRTTGQLPDGTPKPQTLRFSFIANGEAVIFMSAGSFDDEISKRQAIIVNRPGFHRDSSV